MCYCFPVWLEWQSVDHSLHCSFGLFPLLDTTGNMRCDSVPSLLQSTNWATPSAAFKQNSVLPYIKCWWSSKIGYMISARGLWNTSHALAFFWHDVLLIPWLKKSITLLCYRKNEKSISMKKEFVILNMEPLYHLCFLLLVTWDPLQLLFIDN